MAEGGCHPVVFKGSGRVKTFILQKKTCRIHSQLCRQSAVLLQKRLAFADADLVFIGTEIQQLTKPPHAGKSSLLLRVAQRLPKSASVFGRLTLSHS
jgi:hypothetical protein